MNTYGIREKCNKCGGINDFSNKIFEESLVLECDTKCRDCGFEDYWAYGQFQSTTLDYWEAYK